MTSVSLERRMWTLFEPLHAVTYFAPQAREAFEAANLRGFWRGYFAGRAAALGPVGAAPVVACFFGFAPGMVERALPDVWTRAAPEDVLVARRTGARDALASVLSEQDQPAVAESASLLRLAARAADIPGRVLGAANAALAWPDDPIDVAWHAATILREHRGDGHVAALLTAGLDGCESLVWRTALGGYPPGLLQSARGWSDDEWAAAGDRLASRGWLTSTGEPTDAARLAHGEVEATTDRLAAAPWRALGDAGVERLARLLGPLAARVAAFLPQPNPVGLPRPEAVTA